MAENNENLPVLSYKGKPLLRQGDTIYYGSMSDKYIIMLQILESKMENGVPMATRVMVYLQLTDENILPKNRVVKKSDKEKTNLFDALDVGATWLERALAGKI